MDLAAVHVALRAVTPDDYPRLHAMELEPSIADLWRHRGRTPSPEQFVQSLWGGVLSQQVVESTADRSIVGMVTTYDANLRCGTAFVAVLSTKEAMGTGMAAAGLALQMTSLFVDWPFRKLLVETFSPNVASFGTSIGRIFTEQGRLKGDAVVSGAPADRIYLSVDKDHWMSEIGSLVLGRLRPIRVANG